MSEERVDCAHLGQRPYRTIVHDPLKQREVCVCVFGTDALKRVREAERLCWVQTSYFAVARAVTKLQDEWYSYRQRGG